MSVEDDAGIFLLIGRELAVAIVIQKPNNFGKSFLPPTILENLHVHARVVLSQLGSDLDHAMNHIVMLDHSADETDNDGWGGSARVCSDQVSYTKNEGKKQRDFTN